MLNKEQMEVGNKAMASLGISKLTYIRPHVSDKESGFAVCAADGTQLGVFPTYDSAYFTARQNNLIPVNVH